MAKKPHTKMKGCCSLCGRWTGNGASNWPLAKREGKAVGQKRRFDWRKDWQ